MDHQYVLCVGRMEDMAYVLYYMTTYSFGGDLVCEYACDISVL